MRRLSKLTAVRAPEAASSELPRQRTNPETSTPSSTTPSDSRPMSPTESARPVWHKDNFGFWLLGCVLISVVFSVVYRSLA
jgi:hypothetical protein